MSGHVLNVTVHKNLIIYIGAMLCVSFITNSQKKNVVV
jgi:hypothetical protein